MVENALFVYGTLLDTDNKYAVFLADKSKFYSDGWFNGVLYDTGDYPAALECASGTTIVHGQIVLLTNADHVLTVLDEYEGVGANHQQPNEYIRKAINVQTENGAVICWTYLYNLSTSKLKQLPGGRYIK